MTRPYLNLITVTIVFEEKIYEGPRYAVSSLLPPPASYVQIFSSVLCSETPSIYLLLSVWQGPILAPIQAAGKIINIIQR
jgi:hypothetical protein